MENSNNTQSLKNIFIRYITVKVKIWCLVREKENNIN